MKGKSPDYVANVVVAKGSGDKWREVGVAFCNERTGSITVLLDALPVDGKLVLQPHRQRSVAVSEPEVVAA